MADVKQRSFSGAFTEAEFEELKESYHFRIQDWTGMGPMSEFDVYASVVAKPAAGSVGKSGENE